MPNAHFMPLSIHQMKLGPSPPSLCCHNFCRLNCQLSLICNQTIELQMLYHLRNDREKEVIASRAFWIFSQLKKEADSTAHTSMSYPT